MRIIYWGLNLLISFVILYIIGYYMPGFSALTISWLFFLAVLILLGEWLVEYGLKGRIKSTYWSRLIINIIVATIVIFFGSQAIEGGGVPFGGALLAGVIIAGIFSVIDLDSFKKLTTASDEK